MSVPINYGGPAFPCETYGIRNGKETTIPTNGMTLRDYFAGQALAGMLINYTTQKFGVGEETCAKGAYLFADAMLATREISK